MPRHRTKVLTSRQQEIFGWIKGFIHKHGMPPTVREIGNAFKIKSSSVFDLLKILEQKGYLRRGNLGARSLIIYDQGSRYGCGCQEVPVVGLIAAGQPIEAIENDCGTVTVGRELLRGQDAYALKVEGDSMVEAGILDGDYVIVQKQDTAENGDIVVALIEDQATLKRFYRENGKIRLEPANSEMDPIHLSCEDLRIQGKAVGAIRIMNSASLREGD